MYNTTALCNTPAQTAVSVLPLTSIFPGKYYSALHYVTGGLKFVQPCLARFSSAVRPQISPHHPGAVSCYLSPATRLPNPGFVKPSPAVCLSPFPKIVVQPPENQTVFKASSPTSSRHKFQRLFVFFPTLPCCDSFTSGK